MSQNYEYTDYFCYCLIRRKFQLSESFPTCLVSLILRYCKNRFKDYHYQTENLITRYYSQNNIVIGCINKQSSIILVPEAIQQGNNQIIEIHFQSNIITNNVNIHV